jgi:hypothetical protein
MSILEKPMDRVRDDIQRNDLGKARDRLHGLIVSRPDDLALRKQLGGIYGRLQMPEMAGRYWYLEEEKDETMRAACRRFESQFHGDPALMLFAIRFKGDLERINDTFAGRTLSELHQKAKEKHGWYENYRNKGALKFAHSKTENHKTRDAAIKWVFLATVILLIFFVCVGVISVAKWLF